MKLSLSNIIITLFIAADLGLIGLFLIVGGEQYDLDMENNLPTMYQSAKIVFAAGVAGYLAWISRTSRKELLAWLTFAAGFIYLAADEWLQIHENVSRITDEILLQTIGRVSFSAWILAYIPVMIAALVALYVIYKQVISAPKYKEARKWFVLSGLVVFMVPVVEVVGTALWNFEGPANPWLISLEEGLEMVGISLFMFTLLKLGELKRGV